jgi:hypothetical protein
MTPEKILDLGVKIGVVPFMFYIIMLTRSDVKELQTALKDCYLQMNNLSENPTENKRSFTFKALAILPTNSLKIEEDENTTREI